MANGNNTKVIRRTRRWFFTWNNYSEGDLHYCKNVLIDQCNWLIFQEEVAPTTGTPHLQGTLEFKNPKSFDATREWLPGANIEKTHRIGDSQVYCAKLASRAVGARPFIFGIDLRLPEDPLDGVALYDWQEQVLALIVEKPDNRTIHWFWEPVGGCGKSSLVRHIAIHNRNKVICVSGKAADMKYGISEMEPKPEIVIIDISRTMEKYVSYQGMEEVKNGLFFNTKYKSGMVLMPYCHVIVFANFEPDYNAMSQDRWRVVRINPPALADNTEDDDLGLGEVLADLTLREP